MLQLGRKHVGHINGKPGDNEHNSDHAPGTASTEKESIDSLQMRGKVLSAVRYCLKLLWKEIVGFMGLLRKKMGFSPLSLHFPL